jgi:site-specific DNA-methyltransferase (adenine-specific)
MYEIACEKAANWLKSQKKDSFSLFYIDPPFFTERDFGEFNDRWDGDLSKYLDWLKIHAALAYNLLEPGGNFVLHLDWRAVHYAKTSLDSVFGYDNFQNEIIWKYSSGGASKKHFSRKHDNLLWWKKEGPLKFNVTREPYATPNVHGRKGFHPSGRMMTDVWDISIISTTGKERTGYPTQKPLELLERVVLCLSNPGDVVGDFFCGSGTTAVAAVSNGRSFKGCDENPNAVEIAKKRLK